MGSRLVPSFIAFATYEVGGSNTATTTTTTTTATSTVSITVPPEPPQ